jgi:hypothetical protein
MKISRKNVTLKHGRCNDGEGVIFLNQIRRIEPNLIIDVDETLNNSDSFLQEFGFAPKGII